jgi:pimeloyl-ACP methyl ester carboxylesterase
MTSISNVYAAFSTPKILQADGHFYYHAIQAQNQSNHSNDGKQITETLPVFILGGGPGFSSWNLEPIQQKMADLGHSVYLMDMLGIGENQAKKPQHLLTAWVEQVAQLKTTVSPNQPVILVAHSWGALMAMLYTREYPNSVNKIILLNPVDPQKKAMTQLTEEIHQRNREETETRWDDPSAWEQSTEISEDDLRNITLRQIQQVLPTYFLDYEQGKRYAAQFTINDFNIDLNIQAWKEYDAQPILFSEVETWQKPLHFIECKQDYLMPYNLNAMQPNIPLTTVDVIDQCGHFPWIEQPNPFYRTLARTLK